jgi:hypothetical protein
MSDLCEKDSSHHGPHNHSVEAGRRSELLADNRQAISRNSVDTVMIGRHQVPMLSTADEVAAILRTTRKAVYLMAERALLPGVTRIGRRLLFRSDVLLHWLDQKSAPSPKE